MSLTYQSRRVGDIAVVACQGRIVAGEESAGLQQHVAALLPYGPDILLDLGSVEFIDSSGLGLLVRLLTRVRGDGGSLQLCAPSAKTREVLRVTRLATIFDTHETQSDAIAAFYQRPSPSVAPHLQANILCVDKSADVLAYIRELLRQSGYAALTTVNFPDALTLLRATAPKLVIVGAGLRKAADTSAAETFNRLANDLKVIELPPDFSIHEAGEAGEQLIDRVRAVLPPGGTGVTQPGS